MVMTEEARVSNFNFNFNNAEWGNTYHLTKDMISPLQVYKILESDQSYKRIFYFFFQKAKFGPE